MTTTKTAPQQTPRRVAASDLAAAVELLRLARVKKTPLSADELVLKTPAADAAGAIVIDADNGLADVDARLSLSAIGAALARRGYTLPLLRPWSARPLWRLVMSAPFVVDAMVQRGTLVTVDGDAVDAPRAPRHAAGPSMIHAVCGPVPLAFFSRATLRIVPQTHAHLVVTDHGGVAAAAAAFVKVTNAARAMAVDAFGTHVAVLAADHSGAVDDGHTPPAERGRSWGTLAARVDSSRSIAPGDAVAITAALLAGERVAAVPFMQRAAVLRRRRPSTSAQPLVDLPAAARALAAALCLPTRPVTPQERS